MENVELLVDLHAADLASKTGVSLDAARESMRSLLNDLAEVGGRFIGFRDSGGLSHA